MELLSRPNKATVFIVLSMMSFSAAGQAPLELTATIAMPSVKGRIDHLSADVKGHRLFVAALGNDTVEVLDTANNRHSRSVSGFGAPQGLLYIPDLRLLYVANGSADRLDILNGESLRVTRRVDKLDDADNVRFDHRAGTVFVGYGKGALRAIETGGDTSDIRLSGHPESFQLEQSGNRIFVNVPAAHHIAVVDRATRALVTTWAVSARSTFPMALDEKGRRLFVGARSPAVILVHDIDTGKEITKLEIGGDTDDLFFDDQRKQIYAICGDGRVDVFRQETPDRYIQAASIRTAPRARTGLFVAEEAKLYVAAPASGTTPARVIVYSAR